MENYFQTERLLLEPLSENYAPFIFALLNTSGWIKFIGDRNVHSDDDAVQYIQRIKNNKAIRYWVVSSKDGAIPLGLVTLIKRDYLTHHDIGFAFLPEYEGKGYAYEAAHQLLQYLLTSGGHEYIDACTLPDNNASIKLLEKLGLRFYEQIMHDKDLLSIYRIRKE